MVPFHYGTDCQERLTMGLYRAGLGAQLGSRSRVTGPQATVLKWSHLWSQTGYVPWTSVPVL